MKMVITLHTYQLVLPCLLGVEGLVAEELRDMGAENVAPENGRVLCAGSPEMIARANIRSRFAERVLVLLGTFEAKSFESLFRGVKALPWTEWIGRDDAFPVKGRCLSSQLMSVPMSADGSRRMFLQNHSSSAPAVGNASMTVYLLLNGEL